MRDRQVLAREGIKYQFSDIAQHAFMLSVSENNNRGRVWDMCSTRGSLWLRQESDKCPFSANTQHTSIFSSWRNANRLEREKAAPAPQDQKSRGALPRENNCRTECRSGCLGHSCSGSEPESRPYPEGTAGFQKSICKMAHSNYCGVLAALHQSCKGCCAISNCHALLCVMCTSCPSPLTVF